MHSRSNSIFIADAGAWRIALDTSRDADGAQAFGLFDGSPGTPDDEAGYGFSIRLLAWW